MVGLGARETVAHQEDADQKDHLEMTGDLECPASLVHRFVLYRSTCVSVGSRFGLVTDNAFGLIQLTGLC